MSASHLLTKVMVIPAMPDITGRTTIHFGIEKTTMSLILHQIEKIVSVETDFHNEG